MIYRRTFVNGLLESLSGIAGDVHDEAKREHGELLQPKRQIEFLEKLCRSGQQDGEAALGVITTLSPEQTGKKAPWCQILVEFHGGADEEESEGAALDNEVPEATVAGMSMAEQHAPDAVER